jgi:tRNA A37 threonylcarbamoyltransferase TsaD
MDLQIYRRLLLLMDRIGRISVVGVAAARPWLMPPDSFAGSESLEGHVYANFLEHHDLEFPVLSLLVPVAIQI